MKQRRMNLNSRDALISRLRRSKRARDNFAESHLAKTLAYQIRATRDKLGWSQERLAKEVGMNQNAISRLESPEYGRPTITTLKRIASALDVGLVVRMVPFSELVDWATSTPRMINGLTTEALAVANFANEERHGLFGVLAPRTLTSQPARPESRLGIGDGAAIGALQGRNYTSEPVLSIESMAEQGAFATTDMRAFAGL